MTPSVLVIEMSAEAIGGAAEGTTVRPLTWTNTGPVPALGPETTVRFPFDAIRTT